MNVIPKLKSVVKLGASLAALAFLVTACSGGSSSSSTGGSSATAVETPSKVSVVNAK